MNEKSGGGRINWQAYWRSNPVAIIWQGSKKESGFVMQLELPVKHVHLHKAVLSIHSGSQCLGINGKVAYDTTRFLLHSLSFALMCSCLFS